MFRQPPPVENLLDRLDLGNLVDIKSIPQMIQQAEQSDLDKYQFWPTAMAMGSLLGRKFIQIVGLGCEYGPDDSVPMARRRDGFRDGRGKSYIAFDFRREMIAIRGSFRTQQDMLPPALRPLDAELAFDDIASDGIHIQHYPLRHMVAPARGQAQLQEVVVTVCCRRPPKFYAPFEIPYEKRAIMSSEELRRLPYRRRATAQDFAKTGTSERNAGPLHSIPVGPCAYPTLWNAYRWTFRLNSAHLNRLMTCSQRFSNLAERDPEMSHLTPLKVDRLTVHLADSRAVEQMFTAPNMDSIRFSTRCLMEGLVAHGILKPGDVRAMCEALRQNAVVPAFQDRILESMYNQERIRDVYRLVKSVASFLRRHTPQVMPHLVLIRTILVTPTRVLIGAAQAEPSNSVTRRYSDKLDGIIRVQFSDEEEKLYVGDHTKQCDQIRTDVGIMARIRRALQYGLLVGGRTFLPVASSSSQQKDHALWFIDNKMIDGLDLRRWMGSVGETIVAKHAARMGLPFSTSRIVELDISVRKPDMPDVERNGYCFTDGVGVAGPEVMMMAAKALGTTQGLNATPSAIQFRLGGAKGVLTCWPALAGPNEVRLRPSLIKFESQLCDLNVVRLAKYQPGFLNRQFILIMCSRGVPESVVTEIFQKAVRSIRGMRMRCEEGRFTKDDAVLWSAFSDFPLMQLVKAGFHTNPLVLDIVEIIECRALQDLKWRARVKLENGVYLIGVADESGTLEEGEVFCQWQEDETTKPKIVQCEVLVCRAPALHPGDVRRAQAVDRPALRHLKNVLVFSTKGKRDLPNMLGGGDLDGDDYTLIWDQRFVKNLNMHSPMDYTAPEPIRVSKVTQEHLNENFVQYILNDILGVVDNTHLGLADMHEPTHPDCLSLSEVHSTAVDFQKTGVAAVLDPRMKPKSWPDFMDKDETKITYRSEKILGQLFRIVQPDPHFRASDLKTMGYPTDARVTQYSVYDSLIQRLKPIKAQYEHDLRYDMRRYRVCEPEIPSGIAIKNKRRRKVRDQNLNEPLRDAYLMHVAGARDAAKTAIESITFRSRLTEMQVVARHAYALTFEKEYVEEWEEELKKGMWGGLERQEEGEELPEYMRQKPMTSFAWVFWQELVQLAQLPIVVKEEG